ncbi:MAG: DUF2145 domain-containing protein [Opitutales bacterium]|jgi:hypothetical protein
MRKPASLFLFFVLLTCTLDAGSRQSSKQAIDRYGAEYVQQLTDEVNAQMDARQVNVALIARCGRLRADLPEGVDFTHVGIAVFEAVVREDGKVGYTYSVYNLYQGVDGDMGKSHLVQDFTFDLCSGAVEPEIAVIVPSDALQKRILEVIRSPAYAALHNPKYNLIANPFNDQFDNCVTHTLKILVAAIYNTDDQERIYEDINSYFKPEEINLSVAERIGVNFMSGVSDDDQSSRHVKTATFGSLKRFLDEYKLTKDYFVVRVEPPKPASKK